MSNQFGRIFSCVDDVADKIMLDFEDHNKVCSILEQVENQRASGPIQIKKITRDETRKTAPLRSTYNLPASLNSGKHIVRNTCAKCHDGKIISYNFANSAELKKEVSSSSLYFVEESIGYYGGECAMPYSMMGACLSASEQRSVMTYLKSLLEIQK